jgi:hypothetical protein
LSTPSGGNVDITSAANLIVLHQQVNAPGLFEAEIGRRIEHYGNVAQVRSVPVARSTADGPVNERYVNYYQLYWEGSRWWIASIVWDEECPSAPIPKAWIGRVGRKWAKRQGPLPPIRGRK